MCHDEKEGNKNMKLNLNEYLPYMPSKDMNSHHLFLFLAEQLP